MSDHDYTYYLYRPSEDAPYFFKDEFSLEELLKELNEMAEENRHPPLFLNKMPEWGYALEDGAVYIERLPKNIKPEPWQPKTAIRYVESN